MARAAKPLPKPTPDTQPFWDALKQHRLMLPKCKACGKLHFFPRPFCPHCFSWDLEWVRCSGKGKLYSFIINHRPAPGFEEDAPYVIAVVELDEGPRMLSNLIDIEPSPEAVQVDMPVEVLFQDINEETTMFKFRPA
jgi:uncharacterized OB-fold protein